MSSGWARPARHFILRALVAGGCLNALAAAFSNGDFTTYGQIDWANTPAAVTILAANYNTVFASSAGVLEVGNPTEFTMEFSSASALAAYFPDLGPNGALDADLFDPTTTSSGGFGGDVTALVLDIDFSDAGLLPQNVGIPFGDLVLVNFPNTHRLPQLNGLTVRQFSGVANTLLGGGSFGTYTIAHTRSQSSWTNLVVSFELALFQLSRRRIWRCRRFRW